jgi:hypothetical protein
MNNINDAYSALNMYKYENKPGLISALDVLSAPARRVFGGRTIDLINQTSIPKLSTAGRVAVLFFSIVFTPVAIISSAALLLKLVITPTKWEENKVKDVVDALNLLNQRAEQLAKEGDIAKLIQEFDKNPQLMRNPQVYADVKKLVEQKLAENLSWETLTPLLKRLNVNDRYVLVSRAVEQRFAKEAEEKTFTMNAKQIIEMTQEVFEGYKGDQISCYKRIMKTALKVAEGEDYLQSLLKIDLIDGLITEIAWIRSLAARDELARMQAKLKDQKLRMRQFPIEDETLHFCNLMNNKEKLKEIHGLARSIRNLNSERPELENRVQAFVAKSTTPDLWKANQAELQRLMRDVELLGPIEGIDEAFKQLVLKLHQISRDGLDGLWAANDAATIQNALNGVLEQTKEQLALVEKYFEEANNNQNLAFPDKDQTILQIQLKLTYFTVHQKIADLLFLESAKHLEAWFEAVPKAS